MAEHDLKCWPESFAPIADGTKTFELRKNDRHYRVGDVLRLREWEPRLVGNGNYTGREIRKRVTFVLDGIGPGGIQPFRGLSIGYSILSLAEVV